jgi:hypothetical protein
MKIYLIISCLCILILHVCYSTTCYIDGEEGSNDQACSEEETCKTFSHAFNSQPDCTEFSFKYYNYTDVFVFVGGIK